MKKHILKSIKKKNLNDYLPFSISYYTVLQYKQSRIHSFIYLLFHFLLDPDPEL